MRMSLALLLLAANAAAIQAQRGNEARYVYVLQMPNGARDTTRGVATEVLVRQNQRWVNPFWYLEE